MTPSNALPRARSAWQLAIVAAVGVALFIGFVSLGVWQVQRRAWKLDLMERVATRLSAAAVPLPPAMAWHHLSPAEVEYLHVRVQGKWLSEKTVLTQASTALGQGFWVLTPLIQDDGTTVLINRGFIPASQRNQWLSPLTHSDRESEIQINGLIRLSEPNGGFLRRNDPAAQKWYSRDVAAIAQSQHLAANAPFFVDVGLPDARFQNNPEAAPSDAGPWPREGLTVVHFSNSHLVYALTWFGLALMVVAAGGLLVRHERGLRAAGNNTAHAAQR